jgi:hypothetical protein
MISISADRALYLVNSSYLKCTVAYLPAGHVNQDHMCRVAFVGHWIDNGYCNDEDCLVGGYIPLCRPLSWRKNDIVTSVCGFGYVFLRIKIGQKRPVSSGACILFTRYGALRFGNPGLPRRIFFRSNGERP